MAYTLTVRYSAGFVPGSLTFCVLVHLTTIAIESSLRLIKEGHVDGVKLEGGAELAPTVAAITRAGVPVVGHIGLTPQRALAGLEEEGEAFGTTAKTAQMVLEDALAIQKAGAIAVVLEAVAAPASQMITQVLRIPTIGIG